MNIVYIVNQLRRSGPMIVLHDIIRHMDRTLFTPIIIKLMEDDPDRTMTHAFLAMNVEVISLHHSFIDLELKTTKVAHELDHLLANREITIIHTHGYHPVLIASHMRLNCPKIETLHCICNKNFVDSKGFLLGTYMSQRYLNRLTKLNGCAAISDTVKQFYSTRIKNIPIRRIYNGIDPKKFHPISKTEKHTLRVKLGYNDDDIIFIAIGSIGRGKDPLSVIKAFQKVSLKINTNRQARLIFLGKGPLLSKCHFLIGNDSTIEMKGYVSNADEYLKIADYSICASRSEGFGLNFIESVMSAIPVIGSDIGPFKEFTALYPDLKILQFHSGSCHELAAKIEQSSKLSIDLSTASSDARDRFSSKRMAEEYMAFYQEIKFN